VIAGPSPPSTATANITARLNRPRGGTVTLTSEYVAEHVELGYASSIHRSQGQTVDTAHVLVDPTTTREALYVAATRARQANHIYVDIGYDPEPATGHPQVTATRTAREVLVDILANRGSAVSAHQTLRRLQDDSSSFATLEAEYQTLARAAQTQRWESLLSKSRTR
jgi:hypothetical protein